jgi:hypothetical protein
MVTSLLHHAVEGQVERVLFIGTQFSILYTSRNPKFDEAVLKKQMARALGFRSWDHFLKQNHASPLPFARSQKNGARMYDWKGPKTSLV